MVYVDEKIQRELHIICKFTNVNFLNRSCITGCSWSIQSEHKELVMVRFRSGHKGNNLAKQRQWYISLVKPKCKLPNCLGTFPNPAKHQWTRLTFCTFENQASIRFYIPYKDQIYLSYWGKKDGPNIPAKSKTFIKQWVIPFCSLKTNMNVMAEGQLTRKI